MLTSTANVPVVYSNMQAQSADLKQIHIKLDGNVHQALKLEAAYCETTIQDLVVELIKQRISRSEFSNLIDEDE